MTNWQIAINLTLKQQLYVFIFDIAYQQFTLNLFDSLFFDKHQLHDLSILHVQRKDMSGYIWIYCLLNLT